MKRIVLILLVLFVLAGAMPTFGGANTLSGTITGSYSFFDAFDVDCTPYSGSLYYYETYTINVSAAGDYVFTANPASPSSIVAFIGVFTMDGFDPANPTANCLDSDDGGALTLPAGNLTLVVSTLIPGTTGDFAFTLDGPGDITFVVNSQCPHPLPTTAVVHSIPAGAPAFWGPSLSDGTTFNLPAGTWWTTGTSGDFTHVWVACEASPVWVPTNAVAP